VAIQLDERIGRTTHYRLTRPRRRPPASIRSFAAVLGGAMVLLNVLLLLSDRAPGLLKRAFGDSARSLRDRIDAGGRTGIPADRVPEKDFLVHVAIWAIAIALVGLAIWTWRGLAIGALALFATSVVIEVGQGRYSTTRHVDRSDVVANALGVTLGCAAVAGCYLLWSAAAAALDQRPDHAG